MTAGLTVGVTAAVVLSCALGAWIWVVVLTGLTVGCGVTSRVEPYKQGTAVIQQGEHVVVRVGIEGPVLMPLDGGTETGAFQIEFRGLQPQALPEKRSHQGEQHLGADQLPETGMMPVR